LFNWYDVITCKVNKSSGAHFLALLLKFLNFLMFLNIRIDLFILKTYYGQFTLTTKTSLHIIINDTPQRHTSTTHLKGAESDIYIERIFIGPVVVIHAGCSVFGTAAGYFRRRNVGRVWNDI